jgi:hypothetical protein
LVHNKGQIIIIIIIIIMIIIIDLSARYDFVPVAIESHGPLCSKAAEFLSALGRRITANTLEMRESSYLFQRLSITLQRFNAVCISDTFSSRSIGILRPSLLIQ